MTTRQQYLIYLGFRPDQEGFKRLDRAVALCAARYDAKQDTSFVEDIYKQVGKECGKNWTAVERSIRYAIQDASNRGGRVILLRKTKQDYGYPKTAEVISVLAMMSEKEMLAELRGPSECRWNHDEICCDDSCPCCADFCPVAGEYQPICKYFERREDHGA